jgi:hypothetical protein
MAYIVFFPSNYLAGLSIDYYTFVRIAQALTDKTWLLVYLLLI